MRYILVDIPDRENFYPFTLTRSLADCRVGIYTFKERWEIFLKETAGVYAVNYLQILYADNALNNEFLLNNESVFFINITALPNEDLISRINELKEGEKLVSDKGKWIATKTKERAIPKILLAEFPPISYMGVEFINNAIHLLKLHPSIIQKDFENVTANRTSAKANDTNKLIHPSQIFIEEGAQISCSNLNASEGPIYIGKESVIMEGVSIRGPFVLGKKGVIKMNTSIYGATTIGPNCLAGGEIKNSIIMGCSNKGHEGYLGDSIIGYWCNLGAGTCNSNIKNTAGPIQMWNEGKQIWETIGQKMGMLVGDYTRFAIHSSINTGSYIGVCANIFGNGLLPKNIPNFTWGIKPGYRIEEIFEDINNWKKLKGIIISEEEKQVLKHLHNQSA
jgi:UDP-N-acetylglucosamine diphosphorylase/glucosamine-1-phosphate N-acetyltransferase